MLWLFNNVLSAEHIYLKFNEVWKNAVCDEADKSHTLRYFGKNELKKSRIRKLSEPGYLVLSRHSVAEHFRYICLLVRETAGHRHQL